MTKQQIEKLAKKIKKMYYSPEKSKGVDEVKQKMLQDFWDHHIVPVTKEARRLAKKYKANEDLVWIGAMLHDISLIDDPKLHDEMSAIKAYDILIKEKFDKDVAEKVKNIALTHRCKKFIPKTKEEKIVATADALNHFLPSFYLGIAVVASEEYADTMKKNMQKLEKDYEHKIFFPAEKKLVKKRLADFQRWFGF
ncbi:MAG: HD domain-containing protein [Parcubacteria group bacterium]|jgi:putative nucleotidyltransferase with HDIG domain